MAIPRTLPSLNALRAFEAVARLLSFTQAADELHVTPGAVSHQVAALEEALGVVLLIRHARSVALTPAAIAFLPKLALGFGALRDALEDLRHVERDRSLTISVAPAFARRWLLPRLAGFAAAHPAIQLRLSTGLGLIDAIRPEASSSLGDAAEQGVSADLAIRFGRGKYAGQRSDLLFAAAVTPVCSPRLLTGPDALVAPRDLCRGTLLHDDTVYFDGARADWTVWLEAAGIDTVDAIDATRGPRFSHTGLALDAAVDGLGVALGVSLLTAGERADGRLVAPFPLSLPSDSAYYLVTPEGHAERDEMAAFRGWLLEEARESPA